MTTIPTPSGLAGAPLDELKQWLAITGSADDELLVRLLDAAYRMCIQFTRIEPVEWDSLDSGLRHGIIRFAAHQYRQRDTGEEAQIPTSVAALWRPWRGLRL